MVFPSDTVTLPWYQRDSISHKVFITEYVSVIKMTNTALIIFYERRCARSSRAGGKNRRAEERESCVVKVSPKTSLVLAVFDLPTVITFTSKRASSLRLQTCTWTHSHTHTNNIYKVLCIALKCSEHV